MKMWTLPELQELNVSSTATGHDKNHYEGDPHIQDDPTEWSTAGYKQKTES